MYHLSAEDMYRQVVLIYHQENHGIDIFSILDRCINIYWYWMCGVSKTVNKRRSLGYWGQRVQSLAAIGCAG